MHEILVCLICKNVVNREAGRPEQVSNSCFSIYTKCRGTRDRRQGTATEIMLLDYQNVVEHEAGGREPAPKSSYCVAKMS